MGAGEWLAAWCRVMPHLIDFAATKDEVSGRWDWHADFDHAADNQNGDAATANEAWEAICLATKRDGGKVIAEDE